MSFIVNIVQKAMPAMPLLLNRPKSHMNYTLHTAVDSSMLRMLGPLGICRFHFKAFASIQGLRQHRLHLCLSTKHRENTGTRTLLEAPVFWHVFGAECIRYEGRRW